MLHGMHGLIPEEPRPSTPRSIARFTFLLISIILFTGAPSLAPGGNSVFVLYVDVCIISSAHRNASAQPVDQIMSSLLSRHLAHQPTDRRRLERVRVCVVRLLSCSCALTGAGPASRADLDLDLLGDYRAEPGPARPIFDPGLVFASVVDPRARLGHCWRPTYMPVGHLSSRWGVVTLAPGMSGAGGILVLGLYFVLRIVSSFVMDG